MPMDTRGEHVLLEYWGCDEDILADVEAVGRVTREAALATGATIVESVLKKFPPYDADDKKPGVSGVLVLAESHLAIHTSPREGYASVDVYTCGSKCRPQLSVKILKSGLRAFRYESLIVKRGDPRPGQSMRIDSGS